MPIMRYDVIVAGAGPAGSTAAREAAARGLTVLMLDKAAFPRDKPCGGGVNVRTARLLPFSLEPVTERVITSVSVSLRRAGLFTRTSHDPVTYLTQRSRLDAFLAERAVEAGAILRDGTAIREVERHDRHVVVRASHESFAGRALIAADGVNGRAARLAGIALPRWMGVALEGNITPSDTVLDTWQDRLALDLGSIRGGYGWLFPKGDHLNVGVGGWKNIGPSLRQQLADLTRFYGLDPEQFWGLRGYQLPVRRPNAPLADGNIALVGDAAGLLDPFSGEGIYYAVRSGQVAAGAVVRYVAGEILDLDPYRQEIERDLLGELRIAHQLKDILQVLPAAYVGLTRSTPIGWPLLSGLMRGDLDYAGVRRRLGPLWLAVSAVSGLVRLAPRIAHPASDDPAVPRHALSRQTGGDIRLEGK